MVDDYWRDDRLTPRATSAARRLLSRRGFGDGPAPAQIGAAAAQLSESPANRRLTSPHLPALPDVLDTAAALTLLPEARSHIDRHEVQLIGHARAEGLTWEEIADWMQLANASAAKRRYLALRTAFEDYLPPRPQLRAWLATNEPELRTAAATLLTRASQAPQPPDLAVHLRTVADLKASADSTAEQNTALQLYWTLYSIVAAPGPADDWLWGPAAQAWASVRNLITEPLRADSALD